MKKILPPLLPALALLTLGGCATTSTLSTTENDGMYYSSADRVTVPAQVASAAAPLSEEAPAAEPGDVANPDYDGTVGRSSATGSGEYYDDDYYYASRLRRFHSPYRGIGMGYYDFAYTDPFWYGGPALGYSPWGGYGGFGAYDPFFSPWGYGSININIGFGRPWYRPWRGGYGYSPYDYGFGGPWGGYGFGNPWGGYGGGFYGGGGGYYGGNGWGNYYDRPGQRATYGPRRDRATDGQRLAAPNNGVPASSGRGRVQEGGFAGPGTPGSTTSGVVASPAGGGRRRVQELTDPNTPAVAVPQPSTRRVRDAQVSQGGQVPVPAPQAEPVPGGRRWRTLDNTTNGTVYSPNGAGAPPATTDPGRRRRAEWNPAGGTTGSEQTSQPRVADQPRRQRLYEQSSQPSQSRRTYEQPTRTYEQPARSYEPSRSYSEPSRSSSSGNSGGGGSDGGGRRGRVQ